MSVIENVAKWNAEYKVYKHTFKKYGISIPAMADMQNEIENGLYNLSVTTEYFDKTDGGYWRAKPYKRNEEEIDAVWYMNCITAIPMFNDRVTYVKTKFGKLPHTLTAISWGTGDTKVRRTFHFEEV